MRGLAATRHIRGLEEGPRGRRQAKREVWPHSLRTASDRPLGGRPPVSSGAGGSTPCLLCCGAFGLEVRIEVGARGHERKQGAPDGVGGGREGNLGGFGLLGGAGG